MVQARTPDFENLPVFLLLARMQNYPHKKTS